MSRDGRNTRRSANSPMPSPFPRDGEHTPTLHLLRFRDAWQIPLEERAVKKVVEDGRDSAGNATKENGLLDVQDVQDVHSFTLNSNDTCP